jgi:hypothetical protein
LTEEKDLTKLIKGLKLTSHDYPDLRWCSKCEDRSVLEGRCLKCRRKFQKCIVCCDGVVHQGRCNVCKTDQEEVSP